MIRQELQITAEPSRLGEVRNFADAIGMACGLDAAARYELKLALTEAVTNAVRHGSRSAADLVELSVEKGDEGISFSVRDRGRFSRRSTGGGPMAERGRGLEIMERLSDEFDIEPSPAGTEVRLSRRLAAA
jgi:serine/threonine-protein kinase RsbW